MLWMMFEATGASAWLAPSSRYTRLLKAIRDNPGLRFPHRKILEYLAQQYDYERKDFREIYHSTIVRG